MKLKYQLFIPFSLIMFASTLAGAEESTAPGQLSSQDTKFVQEATQGGKMEVEMGQMASEKSKNPMVREYGEQMTQDHQKANDELSQMLKEKGISAPMSETTDTKMMDKLQGLEGADFDSAYMKHMVKDHKADISDFKEEVKDGSDPDLKHWAAQTLPTLEKHLQMAEKTESSLSQ